ncbi:5677_t:CDS:1, partial [Scutellospora calospora]
DKPKSTPTPTTPPTAPSLPPVEPTVAPSLLPVGPTVAPSPLPVGSSYEPYPPAATAIPAGAYTTPPTDSAASSTPTVPTTANTGIPSGAFRSVTVGNSIYV